MNKTNKNILLFATLFFVHLDAIDPFSKIIITSEKAVCRKDISVKKTFIFNYLGNVIVTLADGSKITSNLLEITLDGKGIKVFDDNKTTSKKSYTKQKNSFGNNSSHVKKIIFKNNVKILSKNRQAFSDLAEINMQENTCKLDRNVKIIQDSGSEKKDIPLSIQSNSALINLKTSEITLLGDSYDPVSTVVELSKEILSPTRKKQK